MDDIVSKLNHCVSPHISALLLDKVKISDHIHIVECRALTFEHTKEN